MQSRSKELCKNIEEFLGTYNRSVIQLKTLKSKLEEKGKEAGSVAQMREAINGCEMRQFLVKDTLSNYIKEGKKLSQSASTSHQSEQRSVAVKAGTSKTQQGVKVEQQQQFAKFLNAFSGSILQLNNDEPKIEYNDLMFSNLHIPAREVEYNLLLEQYSGLFNEDIFALKQRLLIDIENIQMYLISYCPLKESVIHALPKADISQDAMILQMPQGCPRYQNVVFNIVSWSIWNVQAQKQVQSETLDMNYFLFSSEVQKILDSLSQGENGSDWQDKLLTDVQTLVSVSLKPNEEN